MQKKAAVLVTALLVASGLVASQSAPAMADPPPAPPGQATQSASPTVGGQAREDPVAAGVPSGTWDVVSGTDHGAAMDWIAGPGVAGVGFEWMPTPSNLMVVFKVFNAQGATFAVVGDTLVPAAGPSYMTYMLCTGDGCPPEDELAPLLSGPMTFEYTSPTTMTLSGSGLVLHLQARA